MRKPKYQLVKYVGHISISNTKPTKQTAKKDVVQRSVLLSRDLPTYNIRSLITANNMVNRSLSYSLFVTVLSVLVVPSTTRELFSATFQMETLIEPHKYVVDTLGAIIDEEQRFLDSIKRLVQLYEEEHTEAQSDINKYLGNPLNSFSLIKQLTVGLDKIQKMFNSSAENMKNVTLHNKGLPFPNENDLSGAAAAIATLQELYEFNTTEFAAGYMKGEKLSRELSFDDCMSLARHIYDMEYYHLAIPWMEEALRKYQRIDDANIQMINEMLDFIAFAYYQLGDIQSAQEWTLKILESEPSNIHARSNLKHYSQVLDQRIQTQADNMSTIKTKDLEEYQEYVERYRGLCRGEFEIPPNVTKSLKCYYLKEDHAFLKIAPFKVEELYYYPKAYIVHDAITNDEIEYIKNLTIPEMTRAMVVTDGVSFPSKHRISQFAWLDDSDHPQVAAISRRTSHFTGLCTDSAEQLQVSNYGIGGHYVFHDDFFWDEEYTEGVNPAWGDRISTVLFYLSDVEQGGATAFKHLGLTVYPKKGSALVWHNLHASGQGNELTRHMACPVLLGDKWVANKWIRSSGQELRWPCHLDREYGLDIQALPFRRKQPT